MSIFAKADRARVGAKRLKLVAPALLLLAAPLSVASASGASADDRSGDNDCYTIDEQCVPFDTITEDTDVFLARAADGSTKGWTDFDDYKAYVKAHFDLDLKKDGDKLVVVTDDEGGGDGAGKALVNHRGAAQRRAGRFAIFYDRSKPKGDAFIMRSPDFIPDLKKLDRPSGGSWNDRISSVSTGPGAIAQVCLKKACAGGPAFFFEVPPGNNLQLTGGLNNEASAVGVFH